MVAIYVVYIYTDKSVTKRLYTKPRCDRMYDTYACYFSDNIRTVRVIYFSRMLTSLYDENRLCVSYLQQKYTVVSTECVIDSHKRKQ